MLALLQSRSGRRYIPAYAIALLYAGLGEKQPNLDAASLYSRLQTSRLMGTGLAARNKDF